MLQDAEVKAPRRVWRAVSQRLDAKAAPVVPWWKWAVPAFAAAALAVGLFFTWNGPKAGSVPDNIVAQEVSGDSAPQSNENTVPTDLFNAAEPSVAEPSASAAPKAKSRRPVRNLLADASTATDSGNPAAPATAASGNASTEAAGTVQEPGNKEVPSETYSEQDAAEWARISNSEAPSRKVRISGLYAQGGLGSNDSNIKYGGTGISRMAPGAGSPDAGISEAGSSTYGVPFTIGLGTRLRVSDKLSFGTGLEYSLLTRTFNGTYSDSYTGGIYHAVHYVGIPVNAYYDLLSTADGLLNLYAWGGGSAEVCVANNYRLLSGPGTTISDKAGALQFSVALGVGVDIPLGDKLSLYLDPAVRYYFHGNQPKSLRTDKPFMFNFDAGLRFNF